MHEFKVEITCNKICKLSMDSFNHLYQKALILIDSNHIKNINSSLSINRIREQTISYMVLKATSAEYSNCNFKHNLERFQ